METQISNLSGPVSFAEFNYIFKLYLDKYLFQINLVYLFVFKLFDTLYLIFDIEIVKKLQLLEKGVELYTSFVLYKHKLK